MGNFSFITILPGKSEFEDIAPHINIAIEHNYFGKLDTKMFFNKNKLNKQDKSLAELDEFNKSLITAEILPVNLAKLDEGYFMLFDVTYDGVSKYRGVY